MRTNRRAERGRDVMFLAPRLPDFAYRLVPQHVTHSGVHPEQKEWDDESPAEERVRVVVVVVSLVVVVGSSPEFAADRRC